MAPTFTNGVNGAYHETDADLDQLYAWMPPQAPAPIGQRKLTPCPVRALRDKRHRGVSIEALMEK